MTNLIFPYVGIDNPLTDNIKSYYKDCSLICLNKGGIVLDGLYSEVYNLSEQIIEKIINLEKLYLDRHYYDKNFDFYSFFANREDSSEMPEMLVRELKPESSLNAAGHEIENQIILSGFFLKLFEKYESEKKSIDSCFSEIQKREQELFYSLTNEKKEKPEEKLENFQNIPQNLIKKRILAWFDIYFYLEPPCLNLVTDKDEYINILSDIGFIEESSDSDFNVFYLSDFNFLVNNSRVLKSKYKGFERYDKKIKIQVLKH